MRLGSLRGQRVVPSVCVAVSTSSLIHVLIFCSVIVYDYSGVRQLASELGPQHASALHLQGWDSLALIKGKAGGRVVKGNDSYALDEGDQRWLGVKVRIRIALGFRVW